MLPLADSFGFWLPICYRIVLIFVGVSECRQTWRPVERHRRGVPPYQNKRLRGILPNCIAYQLHMIWMWPLSQLYCGMPSHPLSCCLPLCYRSVPLSAYHCWPVMRPRRGVPLYQDERLLGILPEFIACNLHMNWMWTLSKPECVRPSHTYSQLLQRLPIQTYQCVIWLFSNKIVTIR